MPVKETATIFYGGDIVTLDDRLPSPEALLVRGEKIAGVGSLDELVMAAPDAGPFDLAGGCLIPSLIDHHLHLTAIGLALLNEQEEGRLFLDLAGEPSAEAIIERVAERAALVKPGDWILGMGWNQHDWGTHELPVHEALSRAVPDHPVFLVRVDAHSAWVNEAAMRRAGITKASKDPKGGAILRGPGGAPTGVLLERAVEPVLAEIPVAAGWEVREAFKLAARALAARGVTEVFDAGFMASPAIVSLGVDLELYFELLGWADADEPLPVNVNLMIPAPSPFADKVVADPGAFAGTSPRIRITHIKLYADGAFGSRGAALTHPYADDPSTRGLLRMSDAEIEHETRRALAAGLDISTHAIGDDAVHRVLAAYCRVADQLGDVDPHRFRIEHFGYSSEQDMKLAADRGFLLVAQPNFIDPDDNGVMMEDHRLGTANAPRVYPWRTLLDLGASLAMSSDYYIAPGPPLLDFTTAVTRANRRNRPVDGWQPQERLSRRESLDLATRLHPAGGKPRGGILRPGERADLAVLSANPRTAPAGDLLAIEVQATFRAGKPTHRYPHG
jgi:hypothetical protein